MFIPSMIILILLKNNYFSIIIGMIDNYVKLINCYTSKCKNEVDERKQLRDEWNNKSEQIYNDYTNKKIK